MFHIIVRTKYQDIINNFLQSWKDTVDSKKAKLYIVYRKSDGIVIYPPPSENIVACPSETLGNSSYIPILTNIMEEAGMSSDERKNTGYFGIFNDDLLFHKGWLEETEKALQTYNAVTPGYINTEDLSLLERAYQETKEEIGVIKYGLGSCLIMRLSVFPRIGMLDPQFDWACDDLDLIWRMEINGLKSVTLKKILIAHIHGATRVKEMKRWNVEHLEGKKKFKDKHGILNYRKLKEEYQGHNYFMNYGKTII